MAHYYLNNSHANIEDRPETTRVLVTDSQPHIS